MLITKSPVPGGDAEVNTQKTESHVFVKRTKINKSFA